jgi:hypothetical protein
MVLFFWASQVLGQEPTSLPGLPDLAGRYYLYNRIEDEITQYTPRVLLIRDRGRLKGYVWSGTPEAFHIEMENPAIHDGRLDFQLRAVAPDGETMAVRACSAHLGADSDPLPYQCRFLSGPAAMKEEIQTGFLVRDRGQAITRFASKPFEGPCFWGIVSGRDDRP